MHIYICIYIYMYTHVHIHISILLYMYMKDKIPFSRPKESVEMYQNDTHTYDWVMCVSSKRQERYQFVTQSQVFFIGLFCKRDLSFWGAYFVTQTREVSICVRIGSRPNTRGTEFLKMWYMYVSIWSIWKTRYLVFHIHVLQTIY